MSPTSADNSFSRAAMIGAVVWMLFLTLLLASTVRSMRSTLSSIEDERSVQEQRLEELQVLAKRLEDYEAALLRNISRLEEKAIASIGKDGGSTLKKHKENEAQLLRVLQDLDRDGGAPIGKDQIEAQRQALRQALAELEEGEAWNARQQQFYDEVLLPQWGEWFDPSGKPLREQHYVGHADLSQQ
eukprot:TRINITY_DN85222_c0_g1_i1.p1 TRINITY_DN85222_c0_g1~~TRINITY_DN85222_c0_g1_i1.p1  ORF type:complete len:198 (+),score=57.23 TRINITY_DN85222_c0_g1_i1:39-596(+)